MTRWVESFACASRVHCVACRARTPAGESFRASIVKLDGGPREFACPFGVPWDTPPLVTLPTPRSRTARTEEQVAAALEACVGCEYERIHDYDAPGCALVKGCCGSQSPLAFRKYVEAGGKCPHPGGARFPASSLAGRDAVDPTLRRDDPSGIPLTRTGGAPSSSLAHARA